MNSFPFLTVLTLIPLAGAIMVAMVEAEQKEVARKVGLTFSLITFVVAAMLWFQFDSTRAGMQFVERYPWIPKLGVEYAPICDAGVLAHR
jgi:NADH-quinone oxidoreductase subunit M